MRVIILFSLIFILRKMLRGLRLFLHWFQASCILIDFHLPRARTFRQQEPERWMPALPVKRLASWPKQLASWPLQHASVASLRFRFSSSLIRCTACFESWVVMRAVGFVRVIVLSQQAWRSKKIPAPAVRNLLR
jgi:hypothetical protein